MTEENSSQGHQAKQEARDNVNAEKFSKAPSTRQRTFGNPRIVRAVSRSLGGKDRHSKVCTIRGLRDRRIRLSIPTAVELYDLQERLGLNQPSKVIDWLLEATKSDIDKLPPFQIPQGFAQFCQRTLLPRHESNSFSLGGFYDPISTFMKDGGNQNLFTKSRYWDIESVQRLKGKEAESVSISSENGKWIKKIQQENHNGIGSYNRPDSAQKLFPIWTNNSSLPSLPNNATYNLNHSEPSSLTLSQFGTPGLFASQSDPNPSRGSGEQFSSSLSVPSGSQLVLRPSSATPSLLTPHAAFMINSVESDPRQFNHIQILSSSSQLMPHPLVPSLHSTKSPRRRLQTPFSSKLLESPNNNHSIQPVKDSTQS